MVEEKLSAANKNANDLRELYLGLLYPTEDYKVYPSRCSLCNRFLNWSSGKIIVGIIP